MMNKLQQLESSTGVGDMASSGGGAVYPVLPSITNISNIGHAGHLATGQPLSTLPILQSCHPSNLMLPLHYTQLQTFDQSQSISIPVGNLVAQHPQSFPGVSSSTYNIAQQQSKQSENNTHNNSNGESSEDEDVHMCGGCKQQFSSYSVFRKHKKSCNIRKKTKAGESNPNLEATAISLLANQFNQTSNTTNRLRDDTDNSIPIWTQPNDEENADTADTGDNDDIEMNGTETGSLICLTMEDGQDQESNLGSLHSSLVTIPQMSSVPSESIREVNQPVVSTSPPNLQIQECLNFSLSDCGQLQFEPQGILLQTQEDKLGAQNDKSKEESGSEEKKTPKKNTTKSTNNKDSPSRKLQQCTFVGCLFTTKYSKDLTRHMTVHTGERPYSCEICLKTFGRQDKLNRHMHIHTGYKPFHCAACDYKAIDKSTLKKHMRVHTDERPYHCQICPYKSKDSSQLTVHLRTHTGDAPFACQHKGCSATFKTNSDLKRHIRTHTGETPYKCDYCDYRVKIKSNLKAHIRFNHRPNEVFKCKLETCDFVTISKSKLKEHIKTHENLNEILNCNLCSFTTNNRQKFTIHLKEHENSRPFKCLCCAYTAKTQAILSSHVNKRHAQEINQMKVKQVKEDNKKSKERIKKPKTTAAAKTLCKPNFTCPVCNAGFVRRDSLRSHVKQHKASGVVIPPLSDTYIGGNLTTGRPVTIVKSSHLPQGQAVSAVPIGIGSQYQNNHYVH